MKKMKWMILALALATPLSALAEEDNGSGYNGPDLSPDSIPAELERGISIAAMEEAVTVCMADGDAETGLRSVLEQFAAQVGGTLASNIWNKRFQGGNVNAVGIEQIGRNITVNGKGGNLSVHQLVVNPNIEHNFHSKFTLSFSLFGGTGVNLTARSVHFPALTYEDVLEEGEFDDFGELIRSTRIVSGLKIKYKLSENLPLSQIPLYNDSTGAKSKFTINGEEYIQCLQSELQKRAE